MNELIMKWSNEAMYEGELKANEGVKDRLMIDLYSNSSDEILKSPLLLIDTAGSLMHEGVDEDNENESKYNNG